MVRLQAREYEPHQLILASAGSLWEPPVVSENSHQAAVPVRNPGDWWPTTSATVLFKHAVRQSLHSSSPLRPDDVSGSWLSALTYMDAIVLADSLNDLISEWQDVRTPGKKLSAEELEKFSRAAGQVCDSLQTSVNQVAAFRKSFPAARYSDFGEAYHFLNRLLGDAKPIMEEIKDEINKEQEDLNLKVSRSALEESRSAIASELSAALRLASPRLADNRPSIVTVLAFIFIPINTASSIFGMNVKEIGDSASIWAFVIIAGVLSACSGLGWFLWRAPWKKWAHGLRWSLKIPITQREREKIDRDNRV